MRNNERQRNNEETTEKQLERIRVVAAQELLDANPIMLQENAESMVDFIIESTEMVLKRLPYLKATEDDYSKYFHDITEQMKKFGLQSNTAKELLRLVTFSSRN